MSITLIDSAHTWQAAGTHPSITLSTSGASIVVGLAYSDSTGIVNTDITDNHSANSSLVGEPMTTSKCSPFYFAAPASDASYTITLAPASFFTGGLCAFSFSGTATSTPLNVHNQNASGDAPATHCNCGSVTPTVGDLLVAFLREGISGDNPTVPTNFLNRVTENTGIPSFSIAWMEVTSGSATNPDWSSLNNPNFPVGAVASFLAGGGGGGQPASVRGSGVPGMRQGGHRFGRGW